MSNYNKSEAEVLSSYDLSLTNAAENKEIKALLDEYGYDEKMLSEGRAIYNKTKAVYDLNKQEDDETKVASLDFKAKRRDLELIFKKDRKKALLAFKRDEASLLQLKIVTAPPRAYAAWLEVVTRFYTTLRAPDMLSRFSRFKIEETYIDQRLADIDALKAAKLLYVKEDGESQQATKDKNQAMDELDQWMDDFKDTAIIALEEKPQLLEVLGYFVRS